MTFQEFSEIFNKIFHDGMKFNCYSRSRPIQIEKSKIIQGFILGLKENKRRAIADGAEDVANQLFHMQCAMNALNSTLQCWINIKVKKFNRAWDCLIDAQEYINVALQLADYDLIRDLQKLTYSMEECLFPGWTYYSSPGITESAGECSICNKLITECDHIEGLVYWGALCRRINIKILGTNHVALVKMPKDKRCIIAEISDDDSNKMLDYFTWEPSKVNRFKGKSTSRNAHIIALHLGSMDFN